MAAAVAAILGFSAPPASAQPLLEDLGFEMDGDANRSDEVTRDNDDWEALFVGAAGIETGDTLPIRGESGGLCTFLTGSVFADTEDRVAWKGGTKDFENFDQWWNRTGGASSKSDLQNVGVAAWSCDVQDDGDATNDHLILQCFGDRLSTSGDTFMGCWGLQNESTFYGNRFAGDGHVNGDVLTVVNFPGNVSPTDAITEEVGVWIWNPDSGGIKGTLSEERQFGDGNCDAISGNALANLACSIVNEGGEDVPWPYASSDSGSTPNVYPRAAFVEMTIDLTEASTDPDFCLATTIVETRQSSSPSSLLDQLVLGQSATCDVIVTVECVGQGVPDYVNEVWDYTIQGTISTTAGSTDDVLIELVKPTADAGTITTVNGVNTVPKSWGTHTFSNAGDTVTVQVKASATLGGSEADDLSGEVTCTSPTPKGFASISKDCVACLTDEGTYLSVLIKAAGVVTNTSHLDPDDTGPLGATKIPIKGFTIFDSTDPDNELLVAIFPNDFADDSTPAPNDCVDPDGNCVLDPGESVPYTLQYYPADIPEGGDIRLPHEAGEFTDVVRLDNFVLPLGLDIDMTGLAKLNDNAMCELCVPRANAPEALRTLCDPPPEE